MERRIPSVLWIGIAALGVMTLMQLLLGGQRSSNVLLVSAILDAVLLAGLLLGHKWAYVAVLILGAGALVLPFTTLGRNPGQALLTLLLNALVIVPVLMATRFFFPARPDSDHV
jgi:hypothetical protein